MWYGKGMKMDRRMQLTKREETLILAATYFVVLVLPLAIIAAILLR